VAEKLSSHTYGMTVNPGDTMTFTFAVTNNNDAPVTLEIRDKAPANTTYLSGAEKVTDGVLCWTLTVPAKGKASVSYTVQVNANAAYGDTVYSDAGTVGGVDVDCPKVYIAKTLSADDQGKIESAADEIKGHTGMALADAIYQKALGKTTGLPTDFATLDATFYTPFLDEHRLKGEKGMLDLIPPGMFGGRLVSQRTVVADYMRLEYLRTRLPHEEELITGDILLAVGGPESVSSTGESLYLFLGDKCLNLVTGKLQDSQPLLNMLLGYDRFVIIRPSIGM